jgi:hypothetical protein
VIRVEEGRALAIGLGEALVSAYDPGLGIDSAASGGDAAFRVVSALKQLIIKPRRISIRLDAKRQRAFKAIGRFTNRRGRIVVTNEVEFSTADSTIAEVKNTPGEHGVVVPLNRGKTTVTAVDPVTGVPAKRACRLIIRKAKR